MWNLIALASGCTNTGSTLGFVIYEMINFALIENVLILDIENFNNSKFFLLYTFLWFVVYLSNVYSLMATIYNIVSMHLY